MPHERGRCPRCTAIRPTHWLAEPFVGARICPFCDEVSVWWPGGSMSMSITLWTMWVAETATSTMIRDDDPPPPGVARDALDQSLERMIREASG